MNVIARPKHHRTKTESPLGCDSVRTSDQRCQRNREEHWQARCDEVLKWYVDHSVIGRYRGARAAAPTISSPVSNNPVPYVIVIRSIDIAGLGAGLLAGTAVAR